MRAPYLSERIKGGKKEQQASKRREEKKNVAIAQQLMLKVAINQPPSEVINNAPAEDNLNCVYVCVSVFECVFLSLSFALLLPLSRGRVCLLLLFLFFLLLVFFYEKNFALCSLYLVCFLVNTRFNHK